VIENDVRGATWRSRGSIADIEPGREAAVSENDSKSCGACAGRTNEADAARDGIGRRTFLAQSAMIAAAAALAACAGADSFTAPTTVSATTFSLSDYPALATVGGVATVSISGSPFALVRTSASSVVALSRVCPHQGNIVNTVSGGFLCPGHGARFDSSGRWIGGERTSSLRSYPAVLDSTAGTVTVG
jgi:Rieske Fe-S protein